jgi:predicted transcriptional regulator
MPHEGTNMVVTTTLKLPEDLKLRIVQLAKIAGKTPHAFMVDALEAETRRSELRRDFVSAALKAEQEVAKYGEVYAMDAVHKYFSDKLAGKSARKPRASLLVATVAPTKRKR